MTQPPNQPPVDPFAAIDTGIKLNHFESLGFDIGFVD